jgi:hypothetical protein
MSPSHLTHQVPEWIFLENNLHYPPLFLIQSRETDRNVVQLKIGEDILHFGG